MADRRFAGNAIRRRQGDPSSHLGMAESPRPAPKGMNWKKRDEIAASRVGPGADDHDPYGMKHDNGPVCHHCGDNKTPNHEPFKSHMVGEPICRRCAVMSTREKNFDETED